MRIRAIEPFPIAYPDPNDFDTIRRTVLVKVTTEEGAVGWGEEPLYPTDDAGYKKLAASTSVRIASGEREFTEAGYRRQMEMGAVEVYGVDPARVEGITGFRRVVQDELVAEKLWHKDGWAYPINAPGLGIDVQEDDVPRLAAAA